MLVNVTLGCLTKHLKSPSYSVCLLAAAMQFSPLLPQMDRPSRCYTASTADNTEPSYFKLRLSPYDFSVKLDQTPVQTARKGNVHKKLIKPRQNWALKGTKMCGGVAAL